MPGTRYQVPGGAGYLVPDRLRFPIGLSDCIGQLGGPLAFPIKPIGLSDYISQLAKSVQPDKLAGLGVRPPDDDNPSPIFVCSFLRLYAKSWELILLKPSTDTF